MCPAQYAKIWPQLADASPLKRETVQKGIDFIIVRELIGGIYFGEHKTTESNGEETAVDIPAYSESEIERIGRIGFETAQKRRGKLCSVEKSNVLDSNRLWKKVMHRLSEEYPDIELTDMLVDNCAMQTVKVLFCLHCHLFPIFSLAKYFFIFQNSPLTEFNFYIIIFKAR
ncbi:MAG: hypothetical protein IJP38_04080 [Oscillospiraceae bacterium]|nr:hypothetical protein [Oscillospiraceae bacterium]